MESNQSIRITKTANGFFIMPMDALSNLRQDLAWEQCYVFPTLNDLFAFLVIHFPNTLKESDYRQPETPYYQPRGTNT